MPKRSILWLMLIGWVLIVGCGVVGESAVAPYSVVQPAPVVINPPAIPLETCPGLTVPFPGTYDQVLPRVHAEERHGEDAEKVRKAATNPDNDCHLYSCTSSKSANNLLRFCNIVDDAAHYAVQWVFWDPTTSAWTEGTSYLIKSSGAQRFLLNEGCSPVN